MKDLKSNWPKLLRAILVAYGTMFLFLESFEVLSDINIGFNYAVFLTSGAVLGVLFYVFDGFLIEGYLKSEVQIPMEFCNTSLSIKFGDLFEQSGWKVVGVNDFFDSEVNDIVISSRSLHGFVLRKFWPHNIEDWEAQIEESINEMPIESVERAMGKSVRYPIGTTGVGRTHDHNFLFVALTKTDETNHGTSATAEVLIRAARGMLAHAREVCGNQPLNIPLMGSELARVNIKKSMLVDLLVAAIQEESQHGRITKEISIILTPDLKGKVNLKNYHRNWGHGL